MNITLPAPALRAAYLIAAKKDVRYYLNGVFISKKGEVVATDGYRLLAIPTGIDMPEGFPESGIIVSRPPVMIPARLTNDEVSINFVPGEWTAVMDWGLGALPVDIIDGNFPAWERVIPKEVMPADQGWGVDTKYLADLPRIAKALGTPNGHAEMILPGSRSTAATFNLRWGGAGDPHVAKYVVMAARL